MLVSLLCHFIFITNLAISQNKDSLFRAFWRIHFLRLLKRGYDISAAVVRCELFDLCKCLFLSCLIVLDAKFLSIIARIHPGESATEAYH